MKRHIKKLEFKDYAHPSDYKILRPLDEIRASEDFKSYFVKLWPKVRQQTIALCGSHFHITKGACSRLYNLIQEVVKTLNIDTNIHKLEFYVEEGYHINSYTLRDNEAFYIVLTTGAVDRLSEEELKFLLGHELGHLISGHVEYHLFLAFLPETGRFGLRVSEVGHNLIKKGMGFIKKEKNKEIENTNSDIDEQLSNSKGLKRIADVAGGITKLNMWNRISEYTADRVGLLACQNLDVALSALMKISGLPQSFYNDASVEEFIKQAHEFNNVYGGNYDSLLKDLDVLDEDHPWLIRRANALLEWHDEEYQEFLLNTHVE